MLFNAIGRYLVMEGRRLGLAVQVVPAVSQLDLVLGAIGLDVTTFGVQVFDAAQIVARGLQPSPKVPTVVMNIGAFGTAEVPAPSQPSGNLAPLVSHLRVVYPAAHSAVIVTLGERAPTIAAAALSDLASPESRVAQGSHLFLDVVRQHTLETPAS